MDKQGEEFCKWSIVRGVWPRLTHKEIWDASWQARQSEIDTLQARIAQLEQERAEMTKHCQVSNAPINAYCAPCSRGNDFFDYLGSSIFQ